MLLKCWHVWLIGMVLALSLNGADKPIYTKLTSIDAGWQRIQVESPWQSAPTLLRIRVPKNDRKDLLPVIYVLPVERGEETQWGNPIKAIEACDPNLLERAIIVAPTFAQPPWYADHPSDPGIQQETYLLKAVVPYMTERHPVMDGANGHLLVGFSKSGWGAWSLLLRYPERFQRAVAWDAPLMTKTIDRYGMKPIFGSRENFDHYQITKLVAKRAKGSSWRSQRLALFGNSNFLAEHQAAHALLNNLSMPHAFALGSKRKHHWETGWLEAALCFLLEGELGDDGTPLKRPKRQQGPLEDPR